MAAAVLAGLPWSGLVPVVSANDISTGAPDQVSPAGRYQAARTAALTGDLDQAMQDYAILLLEEPDNVDYLFGYGQALFWSNEMEQAVRFLEQARKLAPDYEAVWRLEHRARIAKMGGKLTPSLTHFRRAAAQQFPQADWHSQPIESLPGKNSWVFEVSRERLDNDAPDWEQAYLYFGRDLTERLLVTMLATRVSRFGTTDTQGGAGASLEVAERWTVAAGIAASSDPNFLPESALDAGFSRRFDHGWVGGVNWQRKNYEDATVNSFALLAERYIGKYRIAYSLIRSELSSEHAVGHALTVNYYAEAGSRLGLVLAGGEEIELIAPGQILKTDIESVAIIGHHPINQYLGVGWRLGTHRQGHFYRRNAIAVSISGGF